MSPVRTVAAGGGVLWRHAASGKIEVAVVHRPRYGDWSLPKGKAHDDELMVTAAYREVLEETGYSARVGRHLATVRYELKTGAQKEVAYWSMQMVTGRFQVNRETDDLQWLTPERAQRTVSYPADRQVLQVFADQPAENLHQVIVLRHAKAGRRSRFSGNDADRPLDTVGVAQAEALVSLLGLYGVRHLYAADRLRCVQTLTPLAQELRTDVQVESALTEEAYVTNPDSAYARLRELAAPVIGVRAVCSQGKAIAPLLSRWARDADIELPPFRNRKGSVWILTLRGDTLIQADHIPSPLAGKNER